MLWLHHASLCKPFYSNIISVKGFIHHIVQFIENFLKFQLETSLTTLTKFIGDFKSALDKAISINISDKEKAEKSDKHKKDVKDVLGKTLKHVSLYGVEIKYKGVIRIMFNYVSLYGVENM